ncbi:MAG: DUF58 domain-containing protein [Terriglobales bacterium]
MSIAPLAPNAVRARAHPHGRFGYGIGRRGLFLALLGLAWIIPAFWDKTFIYAIAIFDGILTIAMLVDRAYLPRPQWIEIARTWDSSPALSAMTQLHVRVRNESNVTLSCKLLDALHPALRKEPVSFSLMLPAQGEAVHKYAVFPSERGDHRVGLVYLRYTTPLQLLERWAEADLEQTVRVYPNFEKVKKQNIFLARTRQIEMQMRLLRQRGQGKEFESLREYREGDEYRDICWTATARRGKLVTKVHQSERSQPVWIVLDSGRLMRARTEGFSKLDHSVDAALALAQLAIYSGDRVGLLGYGRKVNQRVAPGRGPAHLRNLLEQLATVRAEAPEADHLRAVTRLLSDQKRRSLIVWLTDLAETAMTPEVVEAAGQLVSRHLLIFAVMGQPDLNATAAERPGTISEMYRSVAAQEVVYRREVLLGRLRERGALALEVSPHQFSATLLNQYLFVKERSLL